MAESANPPGEQPKIIVDQDWKAQAQAEKEKLGKDAESKAAQGPAGRDIPPADFAGLVNAMVTNILFSLGGFEDPQSGKRYVDLALAKHYIDLLNVLEDKTKNNLSDDEKKLLDNALYQTRMQYVQIAQRVGSM